MIHRNIKKITSLILPGILLSQTVLPCFAMEEVWGDAMKNLRSAIETLPPTEQQSFTERFELLNKDQEQFWKETKELTLMTEKVNLEVNTRKQKEIRIMSDKEYSLLIDQLTKEMGRAKKVATMEEEVKKKADRGDCFYQYLYGVACVTGLLEKTEILQEDTIRRGITYLNKSINSRTPIPDAFSILGMICLGNISYCKTVITIPLGMPGFPSSSDELKIKGFELISQAAALGHSSAAYLKQPFCLVFEKGKQGETMISINDKDPEEIVKEEKAIARARAAKEAKAKKAENALLEELDNEEKAKTQKAEAQKKKQQELKKKAEIAKQKKVKEDAAAQKKKEDLENLKALKIQQEEAKGKKEEAQKAKQALEAQKKSQKEQEAKKMQQAQLAEEQRNRAEKAAKKQRNLALQEEQRVAAQKKREQKAQKALEEKNRKEKAEQQKNNAPVHVIEVNSNSEQEQTAIVQIQEMSMQIESYRQLAKNEKEVKKKKNKKLGSLKSNVKHALKVGKEVLYKPIVQPIFGPPMTQAINILNIPQVDIFNVRQAVETLSTNYIPGSTIPSRTDHIWEERKDEQGNSVVTKKRQISYLFNGAVHHTIVPLNDPKIIDPLINSDEHKTDNP